MFCYRLSIEIGQPTADYFRLGQLYTSREKTVRAPSIMMCQQYFALNATWKDSL